MNTTRDFAIRAVMYRIASVSPLQERLAHHITKGRLQKNTTALTMTWKCQEAALLWAMYERAVYDYYAMGVTGSKYDALDILPDDLAERGEIELPNGDKRNILELLGIDPSWAFRQLQTANNYSQKVAA